MLWGNMAIPERVEQVQESLGATLRIQDHRLVGFCYRDGNFGRVGVKTVDERLPLAGRRDLQGVGVAADDVCWGEGDRHAIPFPGQLPEPSPSVGGAGRCGWAIGVALP